MALATTCPQCKTSFKVIPDQLKLRRGLVRCGVCQHVFSGIDYLRYVDDSGKARQKFPSPAGAVGAGSAAEPADLAPSGQPGGSNAGSGASPSVRIGLAPGSSARSAGPSDRRSPGSGQPGRGAESAAPQQTIIDAEDELKTAFFLSDSTFGPFSQTRTEDVVPPHSIVAREAPERPPDAQDIGTPAHAVGDTADKDAGNGVDDRGEHRTDDAGSMAVATTGSSLFPPEPARSRRRRSRASALARDDEDDPDVAAANLLARQARDAYRGNGSGSGSGTGGSSGRRGGRSQESSRWQEYGESLGPQESFSSFFAEPRRRYAVAALLVLAALQLTLLFRSEIASRVPALRPVVAVLASAVGLSVDPVRSLASLSIESFELQSTGQNDRLSLNAVLRNKDAQRVRWPAMELTLTDQASAVVVRKVILPADYLSREASRDGLNARSEWPIRLNLDPGDMQLAGYSVALFYP